MVRRLLALTAVTLACTACANAPLPRPFALGASAYSMAPAVRTGEPDADMAAIRKKTMASKVLSAIALERVTGRKPDPSRLNVD